MIKTCDKLAVPLICRAETDKNYRDGLSQTSTPCLSPGAKEQK